MMDRSEERLMSVKADVQEQTAFPAVRVVRSRPMRSRSPSRRKPPSSAERPPGLHPSACASSSPYRLLRQSRRP